MTPVLKPLADQVIAITGASSGTGLATARMAAEGGATVGLIARDETALRGIDTPIAAAAGTADAIPFCATHPRRDITVGGAGRAQALFAAHFPALFERLAPRAAASFVDPTKEQPRPSNLFASVGTGRVLSGEHPVRRRASLYTAASKHPGLTPALAAAVTAGIGAFLDGRADARA